MDAARGWRTHACQRWTRRGALQEAVMQGRASTVTVYHRELPPDWRAAVGAFRRASVKDHRAASAESDPRNRPVRKTRRPAPTAKRKAVRAR